jgi:glycosyltransferase involved in cell wall biosynthesis
MKQVLTIDLRWIDNSGIGTYLKAVVPGLVAELDGVNFVLLGDAARLRELPWTAQDRVEIRNVTADHYSLSEQWTIPWSIPRRSSLYFATSYNIPLLYRGRLVVTVYDVNHLVLPGLTGGVLKRAYAAGMYHAVRRKATAIITISHFTKAELMRVTGERGESSIIPIHLGVSDEWYTAKGLAPRWNLGSDYIVYVGNVKPHKNLRRLVAAFKAIMDVVPHSLLIVGQREGFITGEGRWLEAEVAGAGGRIVVTGRLTKNEVLSTVAHAGALVLPSLYEGFGLPPLEAMAAGVPVLVSDAASLPEVCGDAALYCDPYEVSDIAEKLGQVLTDGDLRRRLVGKGTERARAFSWDACIKRTAGVIRTAMQA